MIGATRTLGIRNWRSIDSNRGRLEQSSEEGQGPPRDVQPKDREIKQVYVCHPQSLNIDFLIY